MSNKLFQGVIYQMKDVIDRTVGVIDSDGIIIACSDVDRLGEPNKHVTSELLESCDTIVADNYTYKPFALKKSKCEYVVFAKGEDDIALRYCNMISIALENIKYYYDEKYDKISFLKNVVLDNILPGDIYVKSRELHFNSDVQRVVFIVKVLTPTEISVYDILINIFPERKKGCWVGTRGFSGAILPGWTGILNPAMWFRCSRQKAAFWLWPTTIRHRRLPFGS